MPDCDIQSLLNDGACLFSLSEVELRAVQFAAVKQWALNVFPELDVSLDAILSRGKCLMGISENELRTIIYSNLCGISSA